MKAVHRQRGKDLGLLELIAIALGDMVGGGIFTILATSVPWLYLLGCFQENHKPIPLISKLKYSSPLII